MLRRFGTRFVNTHHIVSAQPAQDDETGRRWTLILIDGDHVTVDDPTLDLVEASSVVVPAPAGFTLIEAFLPEAGNSVAAISYRVSTIIAFRIPSRGLAPVPITAEGPPAQHEDLRTIVCAPSGVCVEITGPWDSLDAFKADCERFVATRNEQAASSRVTGQTQNQDRGT